MFIKKKKKTLFSPPICIQMSDSHPYLLPIWIQILQNVYLKKKNYFFQQKPTTSHKNYTLLSQNFYVFFYIIIIIILILENIPKFWLSKFYTVIMNLHPSTLMYIIFLLFKSQIFLLITILIPINKFKCLIGFQLLTHCYINSL